MTRHSDDNELQRARLELSDRTDRVSKGAVLLVGLAVTAHILHDLEGAKDRDVFRRLQTAVRNGEITIAVETKEPIRRIALPTASDTDRNEIASIVKQGHHNIGDDEFPKYPHSNIIVNYLGKPVCNVHVESKLLHDLETAIPKDSKPAASPHSLENVATLCNKTPEEIKHLISVNYSPDFDSFAKAMQTPVISPDSSITYTQRDGSVQTVPLAIRTNFKS